MNVYIEQEKLQALLRDFYTLTAIRIVVFDDEFREIAACPDHHSDYCRILRSCPAALKKCAQCDREACEKSKISGRLVTYRCHAGMVEAVAPIRYEQSVIGYVMLGQMLQTDNRERSWEELRPVLHGYALDMEALKSAYYAQSNLTTKTIVSAADIMQACAGYLYLSRMVTLREESLFRRLDEYINSHLADDLSVGVLCRVLNVSKTRLYELAHHNYGMGVADHIRLLRITRAKQLLTETNRKISDIAAACGFPDYNYFTKIFRRYLHTTPRAWRKLNKR